MPRNIRTTVDEERLKTISDRVKAHEIQLAVTQELYKVVVTGDVGAGEPGMLENIRTMSKATQRIEQQLSNYAELDRRVREIEERHAKIDKDNDIKFKELRQYKFYFITLGITNIVSLIFLWLKPT